MKKLQTKTIERELFDKLASRRDKHYSNSKEVITRITTYVSEYLQNEGKLDGLILDTGCGDGKFGKELARLEYSVIGVDISPEAVREANFNSVPGFTAIEGDLEKPDLFELASLDGILCCGILHHFPNIEASCLLRNFFRWLKPGGVVFVWEPNGSNPVMKISNILGKFILRSPIKKLNLFSQYISPNEVVHTFFTDKRAFQKRGFTLVNTTTITAKTNLASLPRLLAILIVVKRFLLLLLKILPFPYGRPALFMVFKSTKRNSNQKKIIHIG